MILFFKKSKVGREPAQTTGNDRLEYFRKLIMDHLDTLKNDGDKTLVKATGTARHFVFVMGKGAKMSVGTIREWKGKKYVKTGDGWKPKYDSHGRGAKLAIAAIKRKVASAKDAQEMMQIVLENRDRFSDKDGHPLPFVQELSKYVSEAQEYLPENIKTKRKEARSAAIKEGQRKVAERKAAGIQTEIRLGMAHYRNGELSAGDAFARMRGNGVPTDKAREAFGLKPNSSGSFKDAMKEQLGIDIDKKAGEPSEKGVPAEKSAEVIKQLEEHAVPMMEVEYSKEEYNRLFPRGEVKTPIKTVKMGQDFFDKLGRKDGGNRRGLLGATYQTLTDPIVVIKEGTDDVYLKSFSQKDGDRQSIVMAVEKDVTSGRVMVSAYKRKEREVQTRIKKADGIAFLKDDSGSRANKGENPRHHQVSPKSPEKSSGIETIRERYQAAKTIEGDEDEIAVGKEVVTGRWKLVEADTPTASHDETTFRKTEGFPTNDDGSTINDRDYERDKAAQEAVLEIAADYDMQALSFDSPVVVTQDGVVISGNNRTMSSKLAARKGTDTKYIEALKRRAKKYGFTAEQVGQFENPRVVFETDENEGYSTKQFARFNESNKKAMNPIESAVKVAKTIKPQTVESIAGKMGEYDTLGELYADKKATNEIFSVLQQGGIIGQFDRPQYVTDDGITGAGKEFLETVLIGSVINEANIRGLNREGCKSIRQKLVRAITPLIENKGMDGYSITDELNKAVDIAMQVAVNKDKFSSVDEFSKQRNMFEEDDRVPVELAKRLEGTQKEFAEFMQTVNGGLKFAANGEADIFLGEVESKDAILDRMLGAGVIKKAIDGALRFFHRLRNGHGSFERKKVTLDRGGESVAEYRWIAKGDFDESRHPRDENGRFSRKGGESLLVSSDGSTKSKAVIALDGLIGKELLNAETGIKAKIYTNQRNKIVSKAAINKSKVNGFNAEQHFAVASSIDKAWENAALVESGDDSDGDPNIASIKRFAATIQLDGEPATAYITVKETVEHGHRIYSLELMEVKIPAVSGGTLSGDEDKRTTLRRSPLAVSSISHLPTLSQNPVRKSSNLEIKKPVGTGGRPITRTTPTGLSAGNMSHTPNERTATTDSESKVSGEPMSPDGSPELTPETPRPMPSSSLSQNLLGKASGEAEIAIDRKINDLEDALDGLKKSLTWSGYPLQGRTKVHGMDISIENRKGSERCGTDKDGHEWKCKMRFDYGYIRGTVGSDKEHLDVYVGPNPESEMVYIVNQNDPVTGDFDEQKVMLGFDTEAKAKEAYLKQYDRPGFFGNIIKMDIDTFKEAAFDKGNKGRPLVKRAA